MYLERGVGLSGAALKAVFDTFHALDGLHVWLNGLHFFRHALNFLEKLVVRGLNLLFVHQIRQALQKK